MGLDVAVLVLLDLGGECSDRHDHLHLGLVEVELVEDTSLEEGLEIVVLLLVLQLNKLGSGFSFGGGNILSNEKSFNLLLVEVKPVLSDIHNKSDGAQLSRSHVKILNKFEALP